MGKYHEREYPGESKEYRQARDELLQAEIELREKLEAVAAQRRTLPLGGKVPEDYVFEEVHYDSDEVNEVRLSELFDKGKDALIVYGFMYGPDWDSPCPSCTSITDSANVPQIRAGTNLVFVAKAAADKLRALARDRGWNHIRYLSSGKNSFNTDYFTEYKGNVGDHHPVVNVFVRRNGAIHHFWGSELFFVPAQGMHPRQSDLIWPLWNYFDLTPEGRGDFWPTLKQ